MEWRGGLIEPRRRLPRRVPPGPAPGQLYVQSASGHAAIDVPGAPLPGQRNINYFFGFMILFIFFGKLEQLFFRFFYEMSGVELNFTGN